MSDDEIKIKPLNPVAPELGTKLYAWGTISTYQMTKAEYDKMFGYLKPTNKSEKP